MGRRCDHRKCRAAGGPCRSLTHEQLFPEPAAFDTRLAEELVRGGWRQTSRKYRSVRAPGAPPYGPDRLDGRLELSRTQFNEFRRLGGTTACGRCHSNGCECPELDREAMDAVAEIIGRVPRALDRDSRGHPFIWPPPEPPEDPS